MTAPGTSADGDEKREEVRALYEALPYPPPVTNLDGYLAYRRNNPEADRLFHHRVWPGAPFREGTEILVAGCGTSEAARFAIQQPTARVHGIDLSRTSLGYSRKLKDKYDLSNLTLERRSIEDAATLGRSFDLIVSSGVLHHLPDPGAGLSALREVLRPDGLMQIMVYARYGRTGVYMIQEYCRRLGVDTVESEIGELQAALSKLPPGHPFAMVMRQAKDMKTPNGIADLLLHPQDRAYTVPELHEWLEACSMAFVRWFHQAPYLPQCGAIAGTPHADRIERLPAREQHAAMELFRGTMMKHTFLARREETPGERFDVHFAGDGWRTCVPMRAPRVNLDRERRPAGAAGVLRMATHRFPDIGLAVSAEEERIFGQLDGRSTLAEVAAGANLDEETLRRFFESLWRHDLIVVDSAR